MLFGKNLFFQTQIICTMASPFSSIFVGCLLTQLRQVSYSV